MCEWLSCREWCDVELVCSGRSLPAHRAVLASVSTFLRQILLSRPSEESPTFIVLPDFDIDAMTSVLYYVYNGEVIIQKHKLDMFMEIVKAMQIFVDEQYLSILKRDEVSNMNLSAKVVGKPALFSSGEDSKCTKLIKLKKGDTITDILSKCKAKELDSLDATFRKVQSSYEDRQRSAVLRDLFIETYPQNGNANGRAAGVPAIPSGSYLGATSELLTNANANHLACGNERDKLHRKKSLFEYRDPNQYNEIKSDNTINLVKFPYRNSFNSMCTNINTKAFLNLSIENKLMDNFRSVQRNFNTMEASCSIELNRNNQDNCYANFNWSMKCRANTNRSSAVKNTILNQVLESPWCPRQPTNFRPCRRKQIITKPEVPKNNNIKDIAINDNNNNLQMELHIHPERVSPKSETCRDDFKCNICDQVFSDSDSLVSHSRQHGTAARYSCTECSKSFSQLRNYKYHMSIHRGTREFAATCTVCGKYFNDRGYLSSHMKIHRNRKEYKCSQCPKSFNQRVAYNMHVRIHTGVKPHVCNECGKAFSRKMLLKQHQRTHSGERPYACPHCDKRFADRSNMTLHLRLHTGVKPFSCTLCPKSFTKKHHLKSHLNFHTGAKPYSCPRCKLAFTQSSNMRTHLKKCKVPELLSQAI